MRGLCEAIKARKDASDHDSSLPCRVQLVRVQEEQAEDGAGRKNGARTKAEEEKATIKRNSECSAAVLQCCSAAA